MGTLTSMCFSAPPKPKLPPTQATPPVPLRSDEQVRGQVADEMDKLKRRQGSESTRLTGGLGDPSYGSNANPRVLLGQ